MEKPVALYLVSGFLGSGKTSFLRHVLEGLPEGRVGVIVNDFGSIGIDGKVLNRDGLKLVEINNGSIFCACLKGGFIRTLAAFLEQPVEYLFVEATGLADPDNMAVYLAQMEKNLEKKPSVARRYDYRGGICVADALHYEDYADVFPVVESQVRKSRLILLNKCEEAGPEETARLSALLTEVNPEAVICPTNYGRLPLERLTALTPVSEGRTLNTPGNRPAAYTLRCDVPVSEETARAFFAALRGQTLRLKGFLLTDKGRLRVDNVASEVNLTAEETGEAAGNGAGAAMSVHAGTVLVIIGRELRAETIREAWFGSGGGEMTLEGD